MADGLLKGIPYLPMSGNDYRKWELDHILDETLVDDDLDFNPYDVESLVRVSINPVSREYGYLARFSNGTVMEVSGQEFLQVVYVIRQPQPSDPAIASDVTLLECDGHGAQMWVLDESHRRLVAQRERPFRYNTPIANVWRWIDKQGASSK